MEKAQGPDKLFFELASENRIAILQLLQNNELKMQEIARQLDMTATEAFRQIQRLHEALLIQRRPDGTYVATNYGRLVSCLLPSISTAFEHRDYFLNHDIWQLPAAFIHRLGEVSGAKLILDTMDMLNEGQRLFLEAEEYAWAITEHPRGPSQMGPAMDERLRKGVKCRFLIPGQKKGALVEPDIAGSLEIRYIPEAPAIIAVTESEAAVCLRFLDGRMDYAGFTGKDEAFYLWAKDLFEHYWSRSR